MLSDSEFIAQVAAHEVLYNGDSKTTKKHKSACTVLWCQIAELCKMQSGAAARGKWEQLLADYMEYLRVGGNFCYASDLEFMQPHLLHAIDLHRSLPKDLDLDAAQLRRILVSDDEEKESELEIKVTPPTQIERTKAHIDCNEKFIKLELASLEVNDTDTVAITSTPSSQNVIGKSLTLTTSVNTQSAATAQTPASITFLGTCTTTVTDLSPVSAPSLPSDPALPATASTSAIAPTPAIAPTSAIASTPATAPTPATVASETAPLAIATPSPPISSPAVPNTNSNIDSGSGFKNFSSLELIFLGYAKTLQKMPLRLQLKTKRKIADIMDDAEMEMFESK